MAIANRRRTDHRIVEVYRTIERYYTAKIRRYGATPPGVDWSCGTNQELRFAQLLKLCDFSEAFSLNDLGCGYGALLSYLEKSHAEATIDYLGIDLSAAMTCHAERLWTNRARIAFLVGTANPRIADYSIASGIFNVKLDQPIERWERFIVNTLVDMHATSRRGFAANFMLPKAPSEPTRAELYRTPPAPWIQFCEQQLGSSVELLAAYGLREFTLLVRR